MLMKNFIATLFIVILFIIGYLRETFFLVVNSVLNRNSYPFNTAYIEPPKFLYQLSANYLLVLKSFLTIFFAMIFGVITYFFINYYFQNKSYNLIVVKIYTALIVLALLFSLVGLILNRFDFFYTISRFIIGLAQYPLLPLILFVLFFYKTHQEIKS